MQSCAESAHGMDVLVVEDEALVAEELQERLTRLGYRVVGVHDTAERALVATDALQPDLVLMDIRLKGRMDGIEAASHIYQQHQIPVIYLTAHSDQSTRQRAMATAPFGYVLKPFQERDLLVAIEVATHRHVQEQRVTASERHNTATLAAIADGVIATDVDGRVTFMNPVAETLTGWRFADAQHLMIERIFPITGDVSRTPMANPVREVLAHQDVVRLPEPCLLIDRRGFAILIDHSAAPIPNGEDGTRGAVLTFRDIRQRRLTEDALRQAEDQLRQAQKMEAIGQLAGGVAHHFNNLLAIIYGYCELLLISERLTANAHRYLVDVREAVERAVSLIRQLLAFSRAQAPVLRVVDLNALIANMVETLRSSLRANIRIITVLDPKAASIQVDPQQMEQVILTLAANARDAMPQGGELTLETHHVKAEAIRAELAWPERVAEPRVRLTVRDTGVGMDEATKARVFEPFFTTKEVNAGAGLGLASVYGIIATFGGHITVDSEPGRGTAFHIWL